MIRAAVLALFASAMPLTAQVAPKAGEQDAVAGTALPAAPCPLIVEPIRFCGSSPDFVLTPQSDNSDVTAYFLTPEGIEAVAIVESLGARDGVSIPILQTIALQILSDASGVPVSAIPILERSTQFVDGAPQPSFVYSGIIEGEPIVYANSILLLDRMVAQFVTVEVGVSTYSPRHRDLHTRFLQQIQVNR